MQVITEGESLNSKYFYYSWLWIALLFLIIYEELNIIEKLLLEKCRSVKLHELHKKCSICIKKNNIDLVSDLTVN